MNVTFIQKSAGRGGSKSSLVETLRAISEQQAINASVICSETGPFTKQCETLGVPVTLAPLPEWRKFFDRLKFSNAMRSLAHSVAPLKPHWVISNEMWWAPHASRLASHCGCHSAVILRDGIATISKSLQYRLQDHDLILPVSSTIGDVLGPHPDLAHRVQVLFDPVSLPAENPSDTRLLSSLLAPFPEVQRWLLVVGKLSSRKNQADAVRLTRHLIDSGQSDLGLLLAGDIDPDYRPEIDRVIAETNLASRVAMIGNFDGITSLIQRAHSVVLPSFREGLPRSLVEAIIAGKPAFSYPCEGVSDIFEEHLPHFVSPESNPASLFHTIQKAWEVPEPANAAFEAVHRRAVSLFSPPAHLEHLTSLLRR